MRLAKGILIGLGWVALYGACADERLSPLPRADGGGGEAPGDGGGGLGGEGGTAGGAPEGALIEVGMIGEVGVLLDELPESLRDEVADSFLSLAPEEWTLRAERQIDRTDLYRSYLPSYLPLPPRETWSIALAAQGAERTVRDGHDVVTRGYVFKAMLFTDQASASQFSLGTPGDEHEETILLPTDPDLLYQRIADQCVDSNGFGQPYFNCAGVVKSTVGADLTKRTYRRLAWDPDVAEAARVGTVTNPDGADLDVLVEGLEGNRISYRYFEEDSCAISEGCVGGPGWRRLLEFNASVANRGAQAMHIGDAVSGPWVAHNTFFYSPCHQHLHFLFYGDYEFGPVTGDKRAFCLVSTSRYHNNEFTPLVTPYTTVCTYQGIAAGWGDDYFIGLDCQWIDITDLDLSGGPETLPLTFESNPEEFLCEGKQVLDASGAPTFEPTEFLTESGQTIDRPVCEFMDGWDDNNQETIDVDVPVEGSFHTEPCSQRLIGPRRSCGFAVQESGMACTPGEEVSLCCTVADTSEPMVVRVCEDSAVLGTTIPCGYFDGRATAVVGEGACTVTFTCPEARDDDEPGGSVSLLVAPLVSDGPEQTVTCVPP